MWVQRQQMVVGALSDHIPHEFIALDNQPSSTHVDNRD